MTKVNSARYQHQRGNIQDNALKALVTDPLFKPRVEKARKGKGSFQRHQKHKKADWAGFSKGESSFKSALRRFFK